MKYDPISAQSCSCSPCCPKPDPCVICPEITKEYAYYSQLGRLFNSALFGAIRFEQPPIQTAGIVYDTGIITIFTPGTYLITYIVNFPEEAVVNTTLALQADNVNVVGTVRVISKPGVGIPYTATAQAILQVTSVTSLRLSSSSLIDITTPPDNTVASLSIVEL